MFYKKKKSKVDLTDRSGYPYTADWYKDAELKAEPDETIELGNAIRANSDIFQPAMALVATWAKIISKATMKHGKCRIVIDYDVELKKTRLCVYTPKKSNN